MTSFEVYQKIDFEIILKEAIAEDLEETRIKPPHCQFETIMAAFQIQRGKKRLISLGKKGLIACAILFLISASLYVIYPEKIAEAGRKLMGTISYILVQASDTESRHPYLKDCDENVMRRLLQAQEKAPFAISLPRYLPVGYVLAEVSSFDQINDSRLSLIFQNTDGQIKIDQEIVLNTTISILKSSRNEYSKKVFILNCEGMLVAHENGILFLSYVDDNNVHFMLKGALSEKELIKVAASLQVL